MNIGCRIHRNLARAPKALIDLFQDIPVANIDDNMSRTAATGFAVCPVNGGKLLGSALTIKVAEGDNLMFHKAMDLAVPGDVFVIDAGGSPARAIFGEIMVSYCRKIGTAGIVVDGSIRDRDEICKLDYPVYAIGATANGPYKNGPGEIGGEITVGGVVVRQGDIVVGDGDGVIFIHPEEAEEVFQKAKQQNDLEAKLLADIEKNGTYPRPWVDEKLAAIGVEYLD